MGDRAVTRGGERPRQQESIAQLWAQAAHDLRQPVQAALLVTRMLEAESAPTEQKRAARHVAAALESLCEMLEVLALLSRIEAGLQVVPLRICQLSDVLEPIMREMAELAAERGISLRFRSMRGVGSQPTQAARHRHQEPSSECDQIWQRRQVSRLLSQARQPTRDLRYNSGALHSMGGTRGMPLSNYLLWLIDSIASELGLGLALLEHLCRRLGHSLHYTKLPRDGQLLAMELPLATRLSLRPSHQPMSCLPSAAAWARLVAPRTLNKAARWIFTVPSATFSARAISLFDLPSTSPLRTWRCRLDRAFCTGWVPRFDAVAVGGLGWQARPRLQAHRSRPTGHGEVCRPIDPYFDSSQCSHARPPIAPRECPYGNLKRSTRRLERPDEGAAFAQSLWDHPSLASLGRGSRVSRPDL